VNYKKPMSFKAGETYPLPPPSTLNGFLHNALRATKYIPMSFSIQGTYKSITYNLQTLYKFGNLRKDRTYWAVIDNTKIERMIYYTNLLVGVILIIHVNSSLDILEKLKDIIASPDEYLSLGRREDLVRIDEVKFVEIEEKEDRWQGIEIRNPIYIPNQKALDNDLQGVTYRLNSTYEVIDKFKKWDMVEMKYVESGKIHNKVWIDEEGDIVFWHKEL